MRRTDFLPILPTLALLVTACAADNPLTSDSTVCQPGSALVLLGDATLDRRCGCNEAALRFSMPTTGFTCTVARGTTVFFTLDGTLQSHQLVPTSGSQFPAGPLNAPSHAVTFSTAGTYGFQDAFNMLLNGQIVVTP